MKVRNSCTTCVTHTGLKTAHKLINCVAESSLVRYSAFNTFRNKLVVACLEVSVGAAFAHSAKATHTTVNLELSALINLFFSRAFFATCNK